MNSPAQSASPARPDKTGDSEEPEIAFEESVPSDGKDPVGEKMIDDLGRDKAKPAATGDKVPEEEPVEPMPKQFPSS